MAGVGWVGLGRSWWWRLYFLLVHYRCCHPQGLRGQVPSLRQRGHPLAPQLQVLDRLAPAGLQLPPLPLLMSRQ